MQLESADSKQNAISIDDKRFHNGEDIKLAGLTEKYEKPDNADLDRKNR